MEVAIDQFARYGLHGASSRELAKAAGVTVAIVNYHFRSKEGLYDAAVDEVYRRLRERIGAGLQLGHPIHLDDLLGRIYRAARRERDGVRLLLRQVLDTGRLTERTIAAHFLPQIEEASATAARLLAVHPRQARTAMVAVSFLMTRYLIQDDRSLAIAFGVGSAKQAETLVIETLTETAQALLHKEKRR